MSGFNLIIQPDEDDGDAAEALVDGAIGGNTHRFLLDADVGRTSVGCDDYTSTFASTGAESSSGLFGSGGEDLIVVPPLASADGRHGVGSHRLSHVPGAHHHGR